MDKIILIERDEDIMSYFVYGDEYVIVDRKDVKLERDQYLKQVGNANGVPIMKKEKVENMAKVTPKNIYKFAQGTLYKNLDANGMLPFHIKEQVEHRKRTCSECLEAGKCVVCGCKTPGRFYSNASCAGGKYPKMMSKEAWGEYKMEIDYFVSGQ